MMIVITSIKRDKNMNRRYLSLFFVCFEDLQQKAGIFLFDYLVYLGKPKFSFLNLGSEGFISEFYDFLDFLVILLIEV